jgi:hypothetical protein
MRSNRDERGREGALNRCTASVCKNPSFLTAQLHRSSRLTGDAASEVETRQVGRVVRPHEEGRRAVRLEATRLTRAECEQDTGLYTE